MELTSSMYATGMHQDRSNSNSNNNSNGVTGARESHSFVYQWRRRCFTAVYSMDKAVATILGRPPLIHRHYCVLDAPLDIDDDDLLGPELDNELQKLDPHGWNTDGKRRATSFIRLRFFMAMAREEALELHLGANNDISAPCRAR